MSAAGIGAVQAQTDPIPALADRENIVLSTDNDDMQFLAGRTVTVTARVPDDVFAAGRDVVFQDAAVGTAIVAGATVTLNGGTTADLIAAAESLAVDGRVEDDVMVVGRRLAIGPDGVVAGDARMAGETITVTGRVGGTLRAAARTITIDGVIDGKVDVVAETVIVGPAARIAGDLVYRSGNDPQIADGAVIGGEVRRLELHLPNVRRIVLALIGIGIFLAVSWLTAVIVLLLGVQIAFSPFGSAAASRILARPLPHLARGLGLLLAATVLAGVSIVSVVGLPIGLAVVTALALGNLFALAAGSLAVGLVVRRLMRSGDPGGASQVGWLIAGLFVLILAVLIPYVGGLVVGLVLVTGFGAVISELWQRLRRDPVPAGNRLPPAATSDPAPTGPASSS
jgi:cytoskeletal protein CcmA (bactofilin family)